MNRTLICGTAAVIAGALVLGYSVGRAKASGVPTGAGALSYSGTLLTFGQPDNSSHNISVALWPNGASAAACTTTMMVQLVNGQFTIPLSSTCVAVVQQNPNVQVQLTIDTSTFAFTQLSAVPYALQEPALTGATASTAGQQGAAPAPPAGSQSTEFLRADATWAAPQGTVPIGSVIAWHGSFANTPTLPSGFVTCSGQTLSDPLSPYNGQVIPNLNSSANADSQGGQAGYFIRGGNTSGGTQQGTAFQQGGPDVTRGMSHAWYCDTTTDGNSVANMYTGGNLNNQTITSQGCLTRPINISMIWIMRVH